MKEKQPAQSQVGSDDETHPVRDLLRRLGSSYAGRVHERRTQLMLAAALSPPSDSVTTRELAHFRAVAEAAESVIAQLSAALLYESKRGDRLINVLESAATTFQDGASFRRRQRSAGQASKTTLNIHGYASKSALIQRAVQVAGDGASNDECWYQMHSLLDEADTAPQEIGAKDGRSITFSGQAFERYEITFASFKSTAVVARKQLGMSPPPRGRTK